MTRHAHRPVVRRAARSLSGGMTLIEIVVATALSLVVLTAVTFAYLSMRSSQRYGTELAQTQGNGRVALEQIGRDIRQAGFIGCNSALTRHYDPRIWETTVIQVDPTQPALPANFTANFTIDAQNSIRAFRGDSDDTTWGILKPPDPVPDSHVIEVRYASLDGATHLAGPLPADGLTLTTRSPFEPSRNDATPQPTKWLGLLSDCQSAVIISAESVGIDPVGINLVRINPSRPVIGDRCGHASRVGSDCFYWPSTTLYTIRVVQYYVAEVTIDSVRQKALMMRTLRMDSDALVWETPRQVLVGATSLRVTGLGLDNAYAVNSDPTFGASRQLDELTDGVNFLPVDTSTEWRRVVRVDVRLRMQPSKGNQAGDAPVIRNFESSYTIRSRVTVDP
jgi:type II secretory pathway pseudopilin PulG